MVLATDSASKSSARWFMIGLALSACGLDLGCARLQSFQKGDPPMLGSAAPFPAGSKSGTGGDFYAQQVNKGVAHSRALLAQEREQAKKRDSAASAGDDQRLVAQNSSGRRATPSGEIPPIEIALQPQQSASPARTTRTSVAAAGPRTATPRRTQPKPAKDTAEKNLAAILAASKSKVESLTSYQVSIKRQERVGEKLQPAEEVLLSIRRQPRAVRLEWPQGLNKGREVIYSASEKDAKMHVKMPNSLLPPLALAPDSPMALRSSRHPITEAGFEGVLDNIEKTLKARAVGDSSQGKLSYGGLENPGQLERPSHKLVRVTPSGENWLVYIDPKTKFPVMVQATAPNGDLLERYLFGPPRANVRELASADAFDPNVRWGQSQGGFLQRLARAGSAKPTSATTTR